MPSKKFTRTIGVTFSIFVIIFLVFFVLSKKESFSLKNSDGGIQVEDQTVLDHVKTDTDADGIADWEEALWGTDKNRKVTFNGVPDNVYIENKKKDLNIEQERGDKTLTETEQFAREFFSAYTALKSSGDVTDESINNFSNALGQRIANPNLINRYTESNIKTDTDESEDNKALYYQKLKNLFDTYRAKGIGDELDIVNNDLSVYSSDKTNTTQNDQLISIGRAYQEFASKVLLIPVPISLIEQHLKIANAANNTGISVQNMAKVITDPLVGLSGLSQYEKYSGDLVSAVEDLENILTQ